MLHIHDAVVVICCTYPEHLTDHGRDLKKDCFYHGLRPHLHDALSFVMAELLEREQAHPMFDTLYTLAKKLEAGQPLWACHYTSDTYREKHKHYPVQQEGWRPWRRREWLRPIPSLGRSPSWKWRLWMVSTCTYLR